MDDLIYMYPSKEDEVNFEKSIKMMRENYSRAAKKSCILLVIGTAFFTAYSLFSMYKHSSALLLLAVIAYVIAAYSFKSVKNKEGFHFLKIKAYENYMVLTYYLARYKKELVVYYEDIVSARFSDKKHTAFQIVFTDSGNSRLKIYNKNDKEIDTLNENLFVFNINPGSWEQAFFLYLAGDYFDITGFRFTKKLERKYGSTLEEYIENLE